MVRSRKPAARSRASRIGRALAVAYPLAAVCLGTLTTSALAQVQELPAIQVVANTPLQGSGVDRDKIPSTTWSVDASDLQRSYSPNVTDTLFQRIPGVRSEERRVGKECNFQ